MKINLLIRQYLFFPGPVNQRQMRFLAFGGCGFLTALDIIMKLPKYLFKLHTVCGTRTNSSGPEVRSSPC